MQVVRRDSGEERTEPAEDGAAGGACSGDGLHYGTAAHQGDVMWGCVSRFHGGTWGVVDPALLDLQNVHREYQY